MANLNVLSCNVRDHKKRRELFHYLNIKSNINIVFLQETHVIKSDERRWKAE